MANRESYLGEFEHVVLLAILSLKDNAYGVTIREALKHSIAREVAIGAIYATTERLEKKGLLTSRKAGATQERGGKAKRYFSVTPDGMSMLQETRKQLEILWQNASINLLSHI
ncbi:helix-turn-helix transcriptional regulator [Paraneptunicella aestuarii]|uniref:PadR family transcriptional regulator n=1 Tax=Paraneptunicella aestuarii TaxID=2831148 RepID=UPI001E4E0AD8|nr:helix-turn-helix transcriptional regulator [Paraneptunicella aestuarii]UAA39231.1 helix-turn-helix transcriptional regulator [Paraneptunicella aestuarii]